VAVRRAPAAWAEPRSHAAAAGAGTARSSEEAGAVTAGLGSRAGLESLGNPIAVAIAPVIKTAAMTRTVVCLM
jgi:hypothetical protein